MQLSLLLTLCFFPRRANARLEPYLAVSKHPKLTHPPSCAAVLRLRPSSDAHGSLSVWGTRWGWTKAQSLRECTMTTSPQRPSSARSDRESPRATSLGKQLNGRYRSSPSYGFGSAKTSPRDLVGIDSPGPKYMPPFSPASPTPPEFSFPVKSYREAMPCTLKPKKCNKAEQQIMPSSIGPQLETHKPTTPSFSFGTGTRTNPAQQRSVSGTSARTGATTGDSTLIDSRKRSSAAFSQSRALRFHTTPVLDTPGPGAYDLGSVHGPQAVSKPVSTWGKATRESRASLPQPSHDSPGPVYSPRQHMIGRQAGRQATSSRPSSAPCGFGTSRRFAKDPARDMPGPGHYNPCL